MTQFRDIQTVQPEVPIGNVYAQRCYVTENTLPVHHGEKKASTREFKNYDKSGSHLKILRVIRMTRSKFYIRDPTTLGAIVEKFVVRATWHPEFVHCYV
jgi:hypothetical protein